MVEIGLNGAVIPDAQRLAARLATKGIGRHSLAACLRCTGHQWDANLTVDRKAVVSSKTAADFPDANPPTKRRDR